MLRTFKGAKHMIEAVSGGREMSACISEMVGLEAKKPSQAQPFLYRFSSTWDPYVRSYYHGRRRSAKGNRWLIPKLGFKTSYTQHTNCTREVIFRTDGDEHES